LGVPLGLGGGLYSGVRRGTRGRLGCAGGARHAEATSLAAGAPPPLPLGVSQRRKIRGDALASPRGLGDAGRGARWSTARRRARLVAAWRAASWAGEWAESGVGWIWGWRPVKDR
jgi:hypothetical protein